MQRWPHDLRCGVGPSQAEERDYICDWPPCRKWQQHVKHEGEAATAPRNARALYEYRLHSNSNCWPGDGYNQRVKDAVDLNRRVFRGPAAIPDSLYIETNEC
eukprot:3036428-Pyramimonas_sp.AAC.1